MAPQADPLLAVPCPRCGSMGSNVHQYTPRRVVDPRLDHVLVRRLTCKVCSYVRRQYPIARWIHTET